MCGLHHFFLFFFVRNLLFTGKSHYDIFTIVCMIKIKEEKSYEA